MQRAVVVTATIVIFTAVMWAVAWVFGATVPSLLKWGDAQIGSAGVWAILIALLAVAGFVGYWPRDAAGKLRWPRSF